jgi:hypothetical protein
MRYFPPARLTCARQLLAFANVCLNLRRKGIRRHLPGLRLIVALGDSRLKIGKGDDETAFLGAFEPCRVFHSYSLMPSLLRIPRYVPVLMSQLGWRGINVRSSL